MRYLAGTRVFLEVEVTVDGTPTDPSSPAPTVTVVDGLGATVASGTATIVGGDSGILRFELTPAQAASPARLTVSWAAVRIGGDELTLTTEAELVGDVLFSEADARAVDDGALASTSNYPDAVILAERDRIHDAFAEILNYDLGRRWDVEILDGSGEPELYLSRDEVRTLRSVEVRAKGSSTWTAFTGDELADVIAYPSGELYRETLGVWTAGRRNIRVAYEHGRDIPLELRRAALLLLRDRLVPSNIPDRATAQTDELGTFSLAVAGRGVDHWFGLPQVDSALATYRRRRINVV